MVSHARHPLRVTREDPQRSAAQLRVLAPQQRHDVGHQELASIHLVEGDERGLRAARVQRRQLRGRRAHILIRHAGEILDERVGEGVLLEAVGGARSGGHQRSVAALVADAAQRGGGLAAHGRLVPLENLVQGVERSAVLRQPGGLCRRDANFQRGVLQRRADLGVGLR